MSTNEKQYYIYLRSTKERIPCTEEEFKNYYYDINLYRQRQQHRHLCVCPKGKWLDCDMDCATCPFYRPYTSLEDTIFTDDDGNEVTRMDLLEDPSPLISDIIADKEHLDALLSRLCEILPNAMEIGKLRMEGKGFPEISRILGIPRNTILNRIKKAKSILVEQFPEFF